MRWLRIQGREGANGLGNLEVLNKVKAIEASHPFSERRLCLLGMGIPFKHFRDRQRMSRPEVIMVLLSCLRAVALVSMFARPRVCPGANPARAVASPASTIAQFYPLVFSRWRSRLCPQCSWPAVPFVVIFLLDFTAG